MPGFLMKYEPKNKTLLNYILTVIPYLTNNFKGKNLEVGGIFKAFELICKQ